LQNLELCDYRAVLFTNSKDEGVYTSPFLDTDDLKVALRGFRETGPWPDWPLSSYADFAYPCTVHVHVHIMNKFAFTGDCLKDRLLVNYYQNFGYCKDKKILAFHLEYKTPDFPTELEFMPVVI